MDPFKYLRVLDEAKAVASIAPPKARFLAGGTLLIDLMKVGVETPSDLIDVNGLPLDKIETVGGAIKIGAMVRNSDLANDPSIKQAFPALSEALLSGASPQLRNRATTGGNILQRTRCSYFRDLAYDACNKRKPGSGCAAMNGWTRMHAVLGVSDACIAAHPSDMCVALVALDAVVHVKGPNGERDIPMADLHVLPGARPDIETIVAHDELITYVTIPISSLSARSRYVKARDRSSYAFALASCAAALTIKGGVIDQARIALGGVGTKPWRSHAAEAKLIGQKPSADSFRAAGEAALAGAVTKKDNAFKVELGKRVVARALQRVMESS